MVLCVVSCEARTDPATPTAGHAQEQAAWSPRLCEAEDGRHGSSWHRQRRPPAGSNTRFQSHLLLRI